MPIEKIKLKKTNNKKTEKELEEISFIAGKVAHELRNPIGVIKTAVYNIKKKNKDSILDPHLMNIDKKILECEQIIKNLLIYTKTNEPFFEKIDYGEIINECLKKSFSKNRKNNIVIINKIEQDKNNQITADRFYIEELYLNIFDNAFQAVSDNVGRIEICRECNQKKNEVAISIEDNGIGIDEKYIPELFQPFISREKKGLGLGLAVCRKITDLHNGKINIESRKGQGTKVTVLLPVDR